MGYLDGSVWVIFCIARGKNARGTIVQSKQCTHNSAVVGLAWLKGLFCDLIQSGLICCPSQHLATLNIALNCAAMLSVQINPPNLSDLIWIECNLTSKSKVTVIELRVRSDCSGLEAGVSCVSSGLSQAVAVQLSIYYHDQLSSCENCDKFSLRFLWELQFNEWIDLTSAIYFCQVIPYLIDLIDIDGAFSNHCEIDLKTDSNTFLVRAGG